jgi:tRNA (guanine37-N1)-methyltransferase
VRIEVVTLFPELFESPLSAGLLGKALKVERATVGFVDPRAHAEDKHRSVDDSPYGGGAGMVMKPDVLALAIEEARTRAPGARVLLLCPQGRVFDQNMARRLAVEPGLVLVCGRYEGFDERVRELVDEEVSVGDFVLTGGELAAMSIIDAVVRLQPGTLGNASSASADSFSGGLLEHPHYTRPPEFRGASVPEVLLGGDHAKIEAWRNNESLRRTKMRRPDLLAELDLDLEARRSLLSTPRPGAELHLASSIEEATEVRALLELAAVYELQAAHFVVAHSEIRAEAEAEIERFSEAARPRPLPRRAKAAVKLEHAIHERRTDRRSEIAQASRVHARPEDLHAALDGARWILASGDSGPTMGPRALRAELLGASAEARYVLAWGPGVEPKGDPGVRLLSGRAEQLDSGNTGVAGLAVRLDRLLGEG